MKISKECGFPFTDKDHRHVFLFPNKIKNRARRWTNVTRLQCSSQIQSHCVVGRIQNHEPINHSPITINDYSKQPL